MPEIKILINGKSPEMLARVTSESEDSQPS